MSLSLFSLFDRPGTRNVTAPRNVAPSRSAMIEELEDRQFFSVAPLLDAAPVTAPLKTQTAVFAAKVAKNGVTTMLPLQITGINVVNGALVAVGKLGSTPFTAPITLGTSPNAADPTCPILDLHLDPIHLNLLGLHVDTSAICLGITGQEASGNLLGNLVCDVSHLLDHGTPLGDILAGLGSNLNTLLDGLTGILNGALGSMTSPTAVTGVSNSTPTTHCDILNLSVGPVHLNLLGLDVNLDNCANGPVTVDITATPGSGQLLGNLLCNVTHLLDNPSNPHAIANLISRIAGVINGLL